MSPVLPIDLSSTNFSAGEFRGRRPYPRASVRRASGFVLEPGKTDRLDVVAVAMGDDLGKGLTLINHLAKLRTLDSHYRFHSARAEILRHLHRLDEAAEAYNRRVLSLTANAVERRYLRRRLATE